MTQSHKIFAFRLTAAVLLAGALSLLLKGPHNSDAVANPLIPAPAQDGQTTPPNQWKYNTGDPLLDGITSWTLPGEGSN